MSSALYTISYKPTCSVVALCSFEKKNLVDQAAWDQFLTTLIGAKLPISISSHDAAIEIAASDLGCDLVKPLAPLDLEAILMDPYSYRVSVDPAGVTSPGDGKEKVVKKAERYAITGIDLTVGTPSRVSVTLAGKPPEGLTTGLLFEGQQRVLPGTTSKSRLLVFDLDAGVKVTKGDSYGVMFFMEDMPVVARQLKAVNTDTGNDPSEPVPDPTVTPAPASDPKAAPASDPKAVSAPGAKATSDSPSNASSGSAVAATPDSAVAATPAQTSKAVQVIGLTVPK